MSGQTYFGSATVKARKRHRCYLCGQPIEPGETYVRHSAADYGKAHSWSQHPECDAATIGWDEDDWEYFLSGSMERPACLEGGAL